MGESFSKSLEPEELAVFKKLPTNTLLDNIAIPEPAYNRRPTDRKFIIVFIVVIVVLLPFLIYTMVNSDMDRWNGYDKCGNVCGKKNAKYEEWPCSGQDYTDEPYLQFDKTMENPNDELKTPRHCVRQCAHGFPFMGRCFITSGKSSDIDRELSKVGTGLSTYLRNQAWRLTLACFLSLGVTIGMLFLFRTATAAVVWGILGGVMIFGAIFVGGLWYVYFKVTEDHENINTGKREKDGKQGLMILCIFFTVALLILFCVMVFMYRKIQLVIQILKEATKAAFEMPLLIFTPIITFIGTLIILAILILTTAFMLTSGSLSKLEGDFLYYKQNAVMVFTLVFNFWTAFWGMQFVTGIQYMVIAGAVSKWYFARNKSNLDSPITTSASIVFKYHLGSIAFGSLVITIVAIIRSILTSLTKNKNLKICVDACMESLETFVKFLSKNSYILIAMHGKPFYKSGKRAAKIIFQNAVNIAAINYIGDFVLGMAHLLIVLISLLITVGLMQGADQSYAAAVYGIVFIVSLIIAAMFFSIFETTIDTIFLCFCEDSLMNDGMARPYAMSRNLMEFVENSKNVYGEKNNFNI